MASKRMFSQSIVESDAYYSLSFPAQALYLHLNMAADDEGVVHSPNKIIRGLCVSEDDTENMKQLQQLKDGLNELLEMRFILSFPSGVIVIKHWRINNTIRKDRFNSSQYQEELATLTIKDNGAYTERDGDNVVADWLPSGCQVVAERLPQNSVDKISKEEYRGEKDSTSDTDANCGKPCGKVGDNYLLGKYGNVILSARELAMLKARFSDWEEKIEYLSAHLIQTGKDYSNHYDKLMEWAREDGK